MTTVNVPTADTADPLALPAPIVVVHNTTPLPDTAAATKAVMTGPSIAELQAEIAELQDALKEMRVAYEIVTGNDKAHRAEIANLRCLIECLQALRERSIPRAEVVAWLREAQWLNCHEKGVDALSAAADHFDTEGK